MERIKIVQILKSSHPLDSVLIKGWIRTKRDAKDFSFIEVNDGSCLANAQVIASQTLSNYAEIRKLTTGSSVTVAGDLVPSQGKGQQWEIQAREITIFQIAPDSFPLQKKRHSDEYLRTIAHLRPRTNKYGAAFRIRSELSFAIHQFFYDRGFRYIHTPILTGSDCEGAGELFRVTTFRAENSNTRRHAAEFWMIEPEMAFCDLSGCMDLAEEMIHYLVDRVMENCSEDIALFARYVDKNLMPTLENIGQSTFERLPYSQAVEILQQSAQKFEYPVEFGLDLQSEHERYLTEQHFRKPVVVYDYPKTIKPFYMRLNADDATVAAIDVLVPGIGEIIGGSQREERLEVLSARMAQQGLSLEDYWWYLDSRRYGSVPHSGFGLGFERLLMLITGISNIRDVIPFPRTPKNIEF
jgi:asparaginyl-tRNA synthetase